MQALAGLLVAAEEAMQPASQVTVVRNEEILQRKAALHLLQRRVGRLIASSGFRLMQASECHDG
ncbi:hypothetical protein D3C71_1565980 [compost metagenome]